MGHESFVSQGHPDPLRAHGAWIYLFASVGSGALVGVEQRVEPAMLVGTGFVGAFLVAAAIAVGARRKMRQILVGSSLAILAPLGALYLDAKPEFFIVAALAVVPAVTAIGLQKTIGFLSRPALVVGVAAIVVAAPTVAIAGGISVGRSLLLFALLWPFFSWQTLRVAAPLRIGATWEREKLRSRGLREAGVAAVWTLAVAVLLHIT
ncbi:MAG: hypothetical protein KDB05_06175 [Planctomycetales bacterium]|nr:hypothetical protein [Planctomycetales bacterium]